MTFARRLRSPSSCRSTYASYARQKCMWARNVSGSAVRASTPKRTRNVANQSATRMTIWGTKLPCTHQSAKRTMLPVCPYERTVWRD